jgi:DNA-binding LacI/PurR family transcriptional regulator
MASLRDVAERAGVSVATASRVANGSAAVREETRNRVESAMRELLYVPPARIEPLSAVGLFVPEFGNPVFAALAEAMEAHATRAGLATILCNTHGSAQRELGYVRMLLERRVEGMVFISAEITDVRGKHSHYAKLLDRGARLVFVNGGSEELEVTSVGVDERAAGRIATEHLVQLGHERIGFVAGSAYALPTREKSLGRTDALRGAGLADGLVAHAAFSVDGGRAALRQLLDRPRAERPTGVICSSDLMAIGAMQEAASAGLDVPGDLSVVGFDGIDAAAWTQPPLTTVEQPIDEIARTAVTALGVQVERPVARQPSYVFRPRLRVGGTTAPPPSRARSTSSKSSKGSKAIPSEER